MMMSVFRSSCLVVVAWATFHSSPAMAEDVPKIDQRFRVLISVASAIDTNEFNRIATSPRMPAEESFSELTLTAALMLTAFRWDEDDADKKLQFRILTDGPPKPSKIAREMSRSVGRGRARLTFRPVTMIHSERITRCEAEVQGDLAKGSFDFRVPEMYEGSADFVAKQTDDQWQIIEFKMETIGIHVRVDESGKWQRVKQD